MGAGEQQHAGKETTIISWEELGKHKSKEDAWIAIEGKVYDVTEWAGRHPGGDIAVLSMAGRDATDAFLAFHPPGKARAMLPGLFMVGRLEESSPTPLAAEYRKMLSDLEASGLFRKDLGMYARIAAAIAAMLALSVAGVLFSGGNTGAHLAAAFLLGCAWSQCGWIGHDAGHSPLLGGHGHASLDRALALLFGNCLSGISIAWWKRNHNAHHIACNSLEYDPDLQYIPLFAVSPKLFASLRSHFYGCVMRFDPLARLLVSYQHLTFYPVMAIARLNLFAQSWIVLLSPRIKVRGRAAEIAGMLVFWAWFGALLSRLPNHRERVAFVLVSFAVTGIQHVQFCLNHFSSPVHDEQPGAVEFALAQARGTLNLSTPPWMDWFHGGLQFQLEHHMFPRLPRHNLRKASAIVKPFCAKHQLPYTCVGFWEANAMIVKTLRAAALQARDWSQPVPKNLLWEAINAQG